MQVFLYQPSDGYRYNSDSIFLYDFIRKFKPKGRVLDIGSGVGILGLLVSRDYPVDMSIVEKQPYLMEYAKHNYSINGLVSDSFIGDIAEFTAEEKYDYIISNPPFYDSAVIQSENERLNIARYSHHMPLETLVKSAKKLLNPKGYFIFCYDSKQADRALSFLLDAKLKPEKIQFVHPKSDRESKIVLIAARNNSKSMIHIAPPLVVFDRENRYLGDAQMAFETASTNVITADR